MWIPVSEKSCYGVAIDNFSQPDAAWRVRLTVGESVHVLEECGEWYFGFTAKNRGLRGIFPKSYVRIMDSVVDKTGPTEVTVLKQPQIVHEITSVLREWGTIWKHLYINHSEHFRKIEVSMRELMRFRSQILSGTLPVDELKHVQRLVTSKIDIGNKLLGLDMVVRDDDGNTLNPEVTSTIQLYKHHQTAADRIKKATAERVNKRTQQRQWSSCSLFVAIRNFVCKMADDAELLLSLYDQREQRSFTENYVVRWRVNRDSEELTNPNLRVLFTDLGSRDVAREKVWLVCLVVRLGSMEAEGGKRAGRKSEVGEAVPLRRPHGVAALDLTLFMSGKMEASEDNHHFMPFLPCDKDNLEGTLRRLVANKELSQREHKNQGLFVSFKLLPGDYKQAKEEHTHLAGAACVAHKMGFPEVILPDHVRNDLYLTLVAGEFSKGSKSTDKNVEVTVRAYRDDNGQPLQGVVVMGGGMPAQDEYRSVVYYHEDKPRWSETLKLALPIDDFKQSHLRFTFKHRSSNETKDKNEKVFALSYVRLMQDDGTTLPDTQHELLVYKVDHKKYDPSDVSYLGLPSQRGRLAEGTKPSAGGLTLTNKDSFTIQTNVCSTKLTQNVDILGLLNWTSEPDTQSLTQSLHSLMKVDGEEVVKFLQDVLDALFNILMEKSDSESCDNLVFECLLYIIGLVSDRKYQHFQHVLDLYIQDSFSATLAYNKLIVVLKSLVDNANSSGDQDLLFKSMKSLQYIVKFIVRSRILFSALYEGKGQQQFELSVRQLMQSLCVMMCYETETTLRVQGACLKYLPTIVPDLLQVFSATQLSSLLLDMIVRMPRGRLPKLQMMTLRDIVHSQLFASAECRAVILPGVLQRVRDLLTQQDEARSSVEFRNKSKSVAKLAKVLGAITIADLPDLDDMMEKMELCVAVLSDIMDLLFTAQAQSGSAIKDVTEVMLTVLRSVIQATIAMDDKSPLRSGLVSVMVAIFRQMTAHHFDLYIGHFATSTDLLDFLMEILMVFKDLVQRPVFPTDWTDMIMLQNSVILKSLRFFSHTIRDYFFSKFEHQAWNNFFHCAIAFLTQPALQLDAFSANKRWRLVSRYKDMRRETGFEIRSMWFNLGQHKIEFVPGMVGPFLEMTLIPETELRRATIPIFFDMMQCEFYSSRDPKTKHDTKRDNIRAHFNEFENEMIAKLDHLVESGRGDEHYKDMFHEIMISLCENHSTMRESGVKFVKIVTRLMERLLEYRSIVNDDNKENSMSCTVNLLDFYSEIKRKEMYIRYVNKLCDLHLECDNFTEAAFTLQLHSALLTWTDARLPPLLTSHRYPLCQTHRQLKEALYADMINYFDKGKMWECALGVCKELMAQYENETYDYQRLAELHRRCAAFYDSVMRQMRHNPEYFRVAYYGRGFPAFLQNKVFIYRGKEFERLSDFSSRTLNQLPNAELMNKLTPPSEDILDSPHQYVQINHVEPVMDDRKKRLSGKPICEQILRYHQVNDVQKFRFSRPFYRAEEGTEENEFASLWIERTVLVTSYPLPGILRWFPVTAADTFLISPLRNAIETMEATNKKLRQLIVQHRHDPTSSINPLSLCLTGIVDAAVNGGINNYEKAFFSADYAERHPEDAALVARLQDLVASQIPLLAAGIALHGDRAPSSLQPLQHRLDTCFQEMRAHVEAKYGKKSCDLKVDSVTLRRQTSAATVIGMELHRLSNNSISSSEPQRATSLTMAQVKSFVQTFNSGGTLTRPTSTLSHKKEKKRRPAVRRNSSKLSDSLGSQSSNQSQSQSQWYTSASPTEELGVAPLTSTPTASPAPPHTPSPTTVYELTQEVQVEKRLSLSRPASGQFTLSPQRLSSSAAAINGSSRDSVGTTDSTNSSEDGAPPPLPVKLRESDYCNLPDDHDATSPSPATSPHHATSPRHKPAPPEPTEDELPPTPPPKRPHIKPPLSLPLT